MEAVKDLDSRLDRIESLETRLTDAISKAAGPVRRTNDTLAYWEATQDGPVSAVEIARGSKDHRPRFALPEGYRPRVEFKSAGEFYRSVVHTTRGGNPAAFHERLQKAIQGMSEAVGADGGYTVLPEFSQTILEKTYQNSIWAMTDNYSVAGNTLNFPRNAESSRAHGSRHGGLRAYWVAEGATITGSRPTMGTLDLKLKKLAVVVYLTDELISDSGMALEQYVNRKVADEFSFMLGDAVFNGAGGGQPLGILNSTAKLAISKEAGQAADTFTFENVVKMHARRWAGSPNYAWFINQDVEPQLHSMTLGVGTGGMPAYLPPGGLSGSPYGTLYGRPVIPTEFNATIGDAGDVVLADLGQYVTISKGGIQQAQSMHVEFLTDQLALRFTLRVDGSPWETTPVTPYKGSNTQSSFVTVEAR